MTAPSSSPARRPAATHFFAWRSGRKPLFGRPCRILEDAGRNVLVEFTDDGSRELVPRRALKRVEP